MSGTRTRCRNSSVGAFHSKLNGNVSAGRVRDHLWDHKRADPIRAFFAVFGVLLFKFTKSTDSAADNNAAAERVFLRHIYTTVVHRLFASTKCQQNETINPACGFGIQPFWGKVTNLATKMDPKSRGVELSELCNTTQSGQGFFPEDRHLVGQGIDRPQSGDRHTTHGHPSRIRRSSPS